MGFYSSYGVLLHKPAIRSQITVTQSGQWINLAIFIDAPNYLAELLNHDSLYIVTAYIPQFVL